MLAALIIALTAFPALGIAAWYARTPGPQPRAIALHWALIGLAMLLGACGLYWSEGVEGRTTAVAIAMVVAVNVLAISLVVRMRRMDRGG